MDGGLTVRLCARRSRTRYEAFRVGSSVAVDEVGGLGLELALIDIALARIE